MRLPQLSTVLVTEPISVPLILQSWPQSSLKLRDRVNLLFLPSTTEKWHSLKVEKMGSISRRHECSAIKNKGSLLRLYVEHFFFFLFSFWFGFPVKFTFISFCPRGEITYRRLHRVGEMRNNLSLTSNLRVILPSYTVTSNETTRKVVFFFFFGRCADNWENV